MGTVGQVLLLLEGCDCNINTEVAVQQKHYG